MHLLDATTRTIVDFPGELPPYAILSHTWGAEEISFQDLLEDRDRLQQQKGYQKIVNCLNITLRQGYRYIWIDTCCINKLSGAETYGIAA